MRDCPTGHQHWQGPMLPLYHYGSAWPMRDTAGPATHEAALQVDCEGLARTPPMCSSGAVWETWWPWWH